jgi:sulfate transport system permease protein
MPATRRDVNGPRNPVHVAANESICRLPPTAVAALCPERLVRGALAKLAAKVAFTPRGMLIAVFVGLPFVVRAVEPIIREFEIEWEESSATLGASR